MLLKIHWESPPHETKTLSIVALPDYREVVKVPYANEPRKPRPVKGTISLNTEGGIVISGHRAIVAYSFDNVLVCRRLDDLSVLWTRTVEPGLELTQLAVSADGSSVAASVGDPRVEDLTRGFRQHYLGVYDGGTGQEVTRLRVDGTGGMALSADGKFIAVVSHERGEKRAVVPTVSIYEISSGRKIVSVAHGPVKQGRHQWLEAGITVAFTPDGRYLITSGMATRLWTLEDMVGKHT
jgi:WD40 repeat protein